MVQRSAATQHLGPIAGPRGLATPEVGERDALAEISAPGIAGEQHPRVRIDLGDDAGRGHASRDAQHPLDVRSHRKTPGLPGSVLDRQARDLHRVVQRHELEEIEGDAVGRVLEPAVPLAVPGHIR